MRFSTTVAAQPHLGPGLRPTRAQRLTTCAVAVMVALLGAAAAPAQDASDVGDGIGPRTEPVAREAYAALFHVSEEGGSDESGDGSPERPWRTLSYALRTIGEAPDPSRLAVLVAAGDYAGETLEMRPRVDLYGGFSADDWQRDLTAHRSVLDGEGERRVVVGADHTRLDGFEVRGGAVRGPGGGLLCEGVSPVVTNNVFVDNRTLAPIPWNPRFIHETAHDGGALYAGGGAAPEIEGNLFTGNTTENGRGGAVALHDRAAARIARNAFVSNTSGTADPMRSSDGGALSIFDWSSASVEGNVFLSNRALGSNDGGGVFVALWSSARIADNVFVDNHGTDDGGALFVGGQEHRYDRPLDPVPPESEFHVEIEGNVLIGNSNSARNSGAMRFTMEARGRFADNVVAHNEGLYVQRSRLDVVRSAILDDLLVVESDRDARAVRFDDSILWGVVRLEGPVAIETSLRRDDAGSGALPFESDWLELRVLGAAFDSPRHRTRLLTGPLPVEAAALAGRVVRAAGRWGIVAAADADGIEVWGDVAGAVSLVVLPSYRPLAGVAAAWPPVRVNKCIELLERDQPIYYQSAYGGYEEGRRLAGTWADYITYNMEHSPLSFDVLRQFMRGLVEGGPTPSGHRTPTVIVVLPLLGLDAEGVLAGAWMVEQALAQGVHGVHLVRARDPKAVEAFVRVARYPVHEQATDVLGEGLRGWGSHKFAAWVWGVGEEEYLERADVWPLNPAGELMLGIKIEDRHALENAERSVAVPGIAFAEHGPRDMGFSYGHLEGRADPPLPPEVWAAGDRVLAACRRHGVAFLDNVLADNVTAQLERGVRIGAGSQQDAAERGRRHTGREMPW